MFGWLRLAAACASRRNRSTNDGSRANSGNSAFSATGRFSDSSRARYTSAMPPRAISRSISIAVRKDLADQGHRVRNPIFRIGRSDGAGASDSRAVALRYVPSSVREHCAAIGAATRPPVVSASRRRCRRARRAPRSRTADASAGANAMNHACGFSPGVGLRGAGLARDLRCPGSAPRCRCRAARPASMNCFIVAAVAGSIARRHCLRAESLRTTLPSGSSIAVGDVRLEDHAAGRDRLGDQRHLERRDRDRALADRRLREQRLVRA